MIPHTHPPTNTVTHIPGEWNVSAIQFKITVMRESNGISLTDNNSQLFRETVVLQGDSSDIFYAPITQYLKPC